MLKHIPFISEAFDTSGEPYSMKSRTKYFTSLNIEVDVENFKIVKFLRVCNVLGHSTKVGSSLQ